jgi:hypothetical protein
MFNSKFPPKKGPGMATSARIHRKSAEDELLDSFEELIDAAEKKLPHDKFMETAEKAKKTLDQAISAHSRRRGTA